MLNENIKRLRQSKGMTQEELAVRLHVVRQTVSKWEKGLSVPDAEMLQKIAEVLDATVAKLLDTQPEAEQERDQVAEQLARLNAQMVIRNRRAKRIWTVVAIVIGLLLLLQITNFAAGVYYSVNPRVEATVTVIEQAIEDLAEKAP